MKKFYEVLRESFNVETLKNYRKVKTFDKLVDALIYARRYSRDCGGKRQFLQMLVFEIQPDDGDYTPLAADFLMHANEAKLIYKAESDGVLRACDEKAEQTSASRESEEADTTDASSTDDKADTADSESKNDNNDEAGDDVDLIDEGYEQGYGTAMCGGEEYILLGEPYEDNNSSGEAAFFARAVKVGDKFDKDNQVPCYILEFKIINPNWENEGKEACDWYEAEDVSFDTYADYDRRFGFCI